MNKILIKIFSLIFIFNLVLFSSAGSIAAINCGTGIESCCCNGNQISSEEIGIRGSCCGCFFDNNKNEIAEKPKALIININPELTGSFIENNFSSVFQSHTNFNSPYFSLIKEDIFLLNQNLRI